MRLRPRRWRLVALVACLALALVGLMLVLVARDDDEYGGAPPVAATTPAPAASETALPGDTEVYKARCREAAGELVMARVIYDPAMTMQLGRAETVEAVVTFNKSLAPASALPGRSDATAQPVGVTCQVQARLRGAADDFDIEPKGWESQALFENRTARWVWQVVPRSGGQKKLIIDLQPAVRIANQAELNLVDPQGAIEPFISDVTVTVPVGKSVESWLDRAGKIIPVLSAFLAGVAGVLGLFKGRAWWRRRHRSGEEPELTVIDPTTALAELRDLRLARGVDAARIAQSLGISRAALQALEDGRRTPTLRNVHDYAAALDIELLFRRRPGPADVEPVR